MAANVVWLASFPKSGNTWFRVLLANWHRGGERPVDINDLFEENVKAAQREAFDSATLLCSGLLDPEEVDRLRPAVYHTLAAGPRLRAMRKCMTPTPRPSTANRCSAVKLSGPPST